MNKKAFTLAETLITLMVIGVVAALTIPALMQQIGDYTLKGQRKTTASKIKEGFARMRVNGALETKYASTAEFVNAMGKYFQISTVCDSNNLTKCFIETVVTTNEGELTENKINEMKDKDKVMGVRFSDGTSMLIKYNTEAEGVSEGYSEAEDKKDAESITTYGGLFEYVYDVNNQKSPNTRGKDIIGNLVLDKGGDPYGLGFEIINNTVYTPDTYCPGGSNDYWTCASNYCASIGGSLPDESQLSGIQAKIYLGTEPDTSSELWTLVGNTKLWYPYLINDDLAACLDFSCNDITSCFWVSCDRHSGSANTICVK